jgi:hypothetical protein
MAVGLATTLIVGNGLTTRATVRLAVQPAVLPVTVYVWPEGGATTVVPELTFIGNHVYEVAPEALSVALLPAHIAVGETAATTVGTGTTFTVVPAVLEQVPLLAVIV